MAKSFFPTLLSAFKEHHDSQGNKVHILVCADSIVGLPEGLEPAAIAYNTATEQNVEMVELNITAGACSPIQYVEDGDLEDELSRMCEERWKEIEEAMIPERKRKF